VRPLRLDLQGFTVFREPTTVDLTDADFFALVGPTGSGKSTVLDAICFALYGTVPRWGDRRRIEHALAPSASEARVRLVFEAAGARFVATRVVRRDGKGRVSTSRAGLEQLPPGFDLAWFDSSPADRDGDALGTVLAGTPAEMDAAVLAAVGLPYEQFTSCVVLPQGEFARFLHAKPADRQEILVNLLGLNVYQRIAERASLAAKEAEAAAVAARGVLADLDGADDDALGQAEAAVSASRRLAKAVEAKLPALADAMTAGADAQEALTRIEAEVASLAAVTMPPGTAVLAEAIEAARRAETAAAAEVSAAEEREEKVRAELATAGDKVALGRLLDAYSDRDRLVREVAGLAEAVTTAGKEHDTILAALQKATAKAESARAAVAQASQAVEHARTADRAASLRPHLVAGEPCPVCEQTVAAVPAMPDAPALRAAQGALEKAQRASESADRAAAERDRALRELDRNVAAATGRHDELAARLAAATASLADAPEVEVVVAALEAVAAAEAELAAAAEALRGARQAARAAALDAKRSQERLGSAWREFDAVRDGLARFGPPPADRDNVVAAWRGLAEWAQSQRRERVAAQPAAVDAVESAYTRIVDAHASLAGLFEAAGVPGPARAERAPASSEAAYRQAGALAVERAVAAHGRIVERREQAARVKGQVAAHEKTANVAKTLALHLRADRFERWLLEGALDSLVTGASWILRELSAGQYDLGHDKGDFFVVDHTDAGLRRAVRTLSGGETFQAALALALALSEQLAGLSTAAASLESIMLDEGFGTLDAATLDTVAATLENLASRGDRMVGVVTHVPALADRIPVRFEVTKDARGNARVERVG